MFAARSVGPVVGCASTAAAVSTIAAMLSCGLYRRLTSRLRNHQMSQLSVTEFGSCHEGRERGARWLTTAGSGKTRQASTLEPTTHRMLEFVEMRVDIHSECLLDCI